MSSVALAIIGVGGVGRHFLTQLTFLKPAPRIIFVSRSSKSLYDWNGVNPVDLENSQNKHLSPSELVAWLSQPPRTSSPPKIIAVDCTASQDVAAIYPALLAQCISIVTPNKKAFSSGLDLWDGIFSAVNASKALCYHESTVGAGLPVISTLKDLIATGDQVTRIEGVFSGTMSFLFNNFAPIDGSGSEKWSDIVTKAKESGYTEPDPRDDLNGMDVARKLTILARLSGLRVQSPSSFPVQSLIPQPLESVQTAAEFMQRLPEHDGEMEKYKEDAAKQSKVVRYVGSIDVGLGKVNVGLEMVNKDSPLAALKGSDNLICFHSERYSSSPLVIQGSGAGGEVTAMGVTADLIKIIERLK